MKDIELFYKYEKIRCSGRYNMITEWKPASEEAGLSEEDYNYIVKHYSIIKEKIEKEYQSVNLFMEEKENGSVKIDSI